MNNDTPAASMTIEAQHRDAETPPRARERNLLPLTVDMYLVLLMMLAENRRLAADEQGTFDGLVDTPHELVAEMVAFVEDRYNDTLSAQQAYLLLCSVARQDREGRGVLARIGAEGRQAMYQISIAQVETLVNDAIAIVTERDACAVKVQGETLLPGLPGGEEIPFDARQLTLPTIDEADAAARVSRGIATD